MSRSLNLKIIQRTSTSKTALAVACTRHAITAVISMGLPHSSSTLRTGVFQLLIRSDTRVLQ